MRKNQHGFSIIEGLLILIAVVILVFVGWYVWHRKNTNKHTGVMTKSLLIEMKDSGSTNSKGWDLLIYTDGSGKIVGSKDFATNTFNVSQLKQSLDTTKLNSQYSCTRSASFGSVETLIYSGKATVGIDCYMDSVSNSTLTNQLTNALQEAGLD